MKIADFRLSDMQEKMLSRMIEKNLKDPFTFEVADLITDEEILDYSPEYRESNQDRPGWGRALFVGNRCGQILGVLAKKGFLIRIPTNKGEGRASRWRLGPLSDFFREEKGI